MHEYKCKLSSFNLALGLTKKLSLWVPKIIRRNNPAQRVKKQRYLDN
jgi:hypothetical protein